MSEVGRGLWTWSHPTLLVKQGHTYSRMPRVMSKWLLNISKGDSPHPPWASSGSAWSPSQEKSVSLCSKSDVMRSLLCPSSTLYFCHRIAAWDDSGAFSVFLVWIFVFTFHLCCHSVLQETALLQKICTFVLNLKVKFSWCGAAMFPFLWVGSCSARSLWEKTLRSSLQ